MRLRKGIVVGLTLVGAVFPLSCKDDTPTGPSSKHLVRLAVVPTSPPETPGLTIDSNTCSCTTKPIAVSVDRRQAGTVDCGSTATFPLAAGASSFRIQLTSAEIEPIEAVLATDVELAAFRLTLRCP